MAPEQITPSVPEERGAGGKLRKPAPRKPLPSPYARPPEATRQRWISKLVDPALRLIAGGATRLLPSIFSAATPPSPILCPTSAADDQDVWKTGDSHEDGSHRSNLHVRNVYTSLKLEKMLLIFSRFTQDEFDRLVAVINSRVMDLSNVEQGKENTSLTSSKDAEHGPPNVSNEQRNEESAGAIWGTSTPLVSKVQDEIGASPIEIARAYMNSRVSEAGPSSKNTIHVVENTVLHGVEGAIKPYDPAPSKKSSTCWPGSVVQDAYITPQSQRRYGLHNFPRTPYSRTLLTKSKSKFIHMQGENNHISSTPILQSKTAMYLQDKSKAGASESGYGSVGPIRRTRHRVGAQSSSRKPVYSSLNGPSHRESSGVDSFTPVAKSIETVGTGSTHKPLVFPVGVPTVHMHSSLMAKKILNHIDRNIPTPKEKFAELKQAAKWRNSESSTEFSTIYSNEDNVLHKLNDFSPQKSDGLEGKKSTLLNESQGNYHARTQLKDSSDKSMEVRKEETLVPDVNAYNSSNSRLGNDDATKLNLPRGGHPYGVNQEKQAPTNPATIKPVLPPIAIKKPESRWTVASDNGSGFTFPVSTSSSVFSEPPTPSIMPLFSAGDQHQLKEGSTELSYSFGLKKCPTIVFCFPSTSNTTVQNEAGDPKFNFGSTKKTNLSFSFKNNAVRC
ncbi:hypothetical protein LR48_Vigan04g024800 [Vigna angularis]|uniref:Nuclear pore complex protein NUP1 n=1 Tax=Phaseolus angularis TaxID=3914 RepID=A0A0L9UAW0_PHAAN|nr:hypothetical protein LR48_Vigan04g024800 [Vigna angularis]